MKTAEEWMVITGNPVDGFTYYTGFEVADSANEFADHYIKNESWWVTKVTKVIEA